MHFNTLEQVRQQIYDCFVRRGAHSKGTYPMFYNARPQQSQPQANQPNPLAACYPAAPSYEIIEALPFGIIPGGSNIRVLLRRLR